jgi:hypothetical protein
MCKKYIDKIRNSNYSVTIMRPTPIASTPERFVSQRASLWLRIAAPRPAGFGALSDPERRSGTVRNQDALNPLKTNGRNRSFRALNDCKDLTPLSRNEALSAEPGKKSKKLRKCALKPLKSLRRVTLCAGAPPRLPIGEPLIICQRE